MVDSLVAQEDCHSGPPRHASIHTVGRARKEHTFLEATELWAPTRQLLLFISDIHSRDVGRLAGSPWSALSADQSGLLSEHRRTAPELMALTKPTCQKLWSKFCVRFHQVKSWQLWPPGAVADTVGLDRGRAFSGAIRCAYMKAETAGRFVSRCGETEFDFWVPCMSPA